jgi:hypothetical protein
MTVHYVGATKRSDLVHGRTVRRRKELLFTEITEPTPTAPWWPTRCRPTGSRDDQFPHPKPRSVAP